MTTTPQPPQSSPPDPTFLFLLDEAAAELTDSEADGAPRPRWAVEYGTDRSTRAVRRINESMIELAELCVPDEDADVVDHYASLQSRLAVTRSRAETYTELGLLCRRMPALAEHLQGGMLSYDHLRVLSRAADGVDRADEAATAAVEQALIAALTPRRPGQAMPGPRTLYRRLAAAVSSVDALARPLDPDRPADPPPPREREVTVDTWDPESTVITTTLPAAEAAELLTVLDAVCRDRSCSRAEGLLHLARGTAKVNVTLNLYREISSDTAVTGSGHWLDRIATEEFTDRVTHLRVPGHTAVESYTPTDAMRATVRGRDGGCRFPGCDVPAERCGLDHVRRYDHDDPAGGPTDTRNLQCLCRLHHLLKTLGWWEATIAPDGTVMWTSVNDGHTYVTEPTGPLATFARTTFAEQSVRRYAAVRDHNTGQLPEDDGDVPY